MEYINNLRKLKFNEDSEIHIKKRKEFIQATKRDDTLAIVLKAHLYIEAELEELLRLGTKNYKVLHLKYFKEKLNLCYGIGLIDKDLYTVLKKFNTIRNKYGHSVDFEITEIDFKEMYDLMNSEQKEEYSEDLKISTMFSQETFDIRLRLLLASLYSEVVVFCQSVNSTIAENFLEWKINILNENSDILKRGR
ncbi:hypothetical protein ACFO6R_06325 [Eubacterium multiforme]|uniref:Apea-like HEPN domain-containing protein n=1 Tax=Eubacterium multiforme TaxID=83339 RepID=A0ABT9USC1_9FIRM|nr:hypothetical protein [Eubacterium multiforme]MDQ0149209.1 hypothetical protein [Eubacterium multiforme]